MLARTKPTWEQVIAARVDRLGYGKYFPSRALEEVAKLLQEEWEIADHWSSMGDDKERLVSVGKMQGLDYAINVLELVYPLIDVWTAERIEGVE